MPGFVLGFCRVAMHILHKMMVLDTLDYMVLAPCRWLLENAETRCITLQPKQKRCPWPLIAKSCACR